MVPLAASLVLASCVGNRVDSSSAPSLVISSGDAPCAGEEVPALRIDIADDGSVLGTVLPTTPDPESSPSSFMLAWPAGYSLIKDDDGVAVADGDGIRVARSGTVLRRWQVCRGAGDLLTIQGPPPAVSPP